MYSVDQSGDVFDEKGVLVTPDDCNPSYKSYVEWLARGCTPTIRVGAPITTPPEEEIASARDWGRELVRQVEADADRVCLNDDPDEALRTDRYLSEASAALERGRLHVAYAVLGELLAEPDEERPRFVTRELLSNIRGAVAARIKIEAARK